jgi:uncharacterized membrane protein YhaH (DUF805 family)
MHTRPFGRRAPTAIAQAVTLPEVQLPLAPTWEIDAVFNLLFRAKGRFSRKAYRIARLGIIACHLAIYLFTMQLRTALPAAGPWHLLAALLTVLLALGLVLWCDVAITIKRWHDLDKSAWWALLGLVPVAGWLGQSLVCSFKNGTTGVNRFGPIMG